MELKTTLKDTVRLNAQEIVKTQFIFNYTYILEDDNDISLTQSETLCQSFK